MNWDIIRAYIDHFLPREVVGPVIIVFSLESVIDGLFTHYMPDQYELAGWFVIFLLSIVVVAYWGTADEQAVEELQERIEEIEEQTNES